jgi:hypothetical protein
MLTWRNWGSCKMSHESNATFSQRVCAARLRGEVGSAIASSLRDPTQEVPTGAAHLNLALFCRLCVPEIWTLT